MIKEQYPLESICRDLQSKGRRVRIRTENYVDGCIPGEIEARVIVERMGWNPFSYKLLASEGAFNSMKLAYDGTDEQLSDAVRLATQRIHGLTAVRYQDLPHSTTY